MIARAAAALAAAAAAGASLALAWHHPLSPLAALGGCCLMAALTFVRPATWPGWLLPLLPLMGLMPWTGWLVVEELDLALLAVAAGGYARWAVAWPVANGSDPPPPTAALRMGPAWWWLLPLALSTAISMDRGFADAGGLSWGWWQGYREPLNSLRLAKPMAHLLLLLPLWRRGLRTHNAAARSLRQGVFWMLLVVALCVAWERIAYTSLLDFSSDYRVTGPFWEMHVGGAALDAVLVLAMPFAAAALSAASTPQRWAVAVAVLGLSAYAALTTFSRIVYLAAPAGLAMWWIVKARQTAAKGSPRFLPRSAMAMALWMAGVALAAAWMFPASGYRGMLSLLSSVLLLLRLPAVMQGQPLPVWVRGLLAGAVGAVIVAVVSLLVPKGAYLAFAAFWLATLMLLFRAGQRPGERWWAALSLAGVVAVLAGVVAVGVNWGGAPAWAPGLGAALGLAVVFALSAGRRAPAWPADWRWQGQLLAGMTVLAAVVGVFGGGAYMAGRMTSTSSDSEGRQMHWKRSLSWLNSTDWLLGKGLGRYAANHALSGRLDDQVGDYRLLPDQGGSRGQTVVLTSGKHELGFGEIFRLSQRVSEPAPGATVLKLDLRVEQATEIDVEVCEKHLLYVSNCLEHRLQVDKRLGLWHEQTLVLRGDKPSRGAWFAPRWIVFSIGLGTRGSRAEIANLRLTDALGRELLVNGSFERGLAHWYFTSDRHHLPWHAKNLAVHLLFEQGLLGLLTFGLAAFAALWRMTIGAARGHRLAPALAGALVAVLAVGVIDSLLDMPRVSWLILLVIATALSLPRDRPTLKPTLKAAPRP